MSKKKNNPNQEPDLFADMGDESNADSDADAKAVATAPRVVPNTADVDSLTLATYAERAYLDYAISVVKGRALPEVADGQKPVQRRILHSMREMEDGRYNNILNLKP